MTANLLLTLQEAHAFDPFPVREDLGVYHVPFSELTGDAHMSTPSATDADATSDLPSLATAAPASRA